MEAELNRYRQRKAADERWGRMKAGMENTWNSITTKISSALLPDSGDSDNDEDQDEAGSDRNQPLEGDEDDIDSEREPEVRQNQPGTSRQGSSSTPKRMRRNREPERNLNLNADEIGGDVQGNPEDIANSKYTTSWLLFLLKFLTWAFLYLGFIKVGFGAVFFAVSAIYFIYVNTGVRKKKRKGEVSAYSVFNENCEAIDGTLKAEHLERQLLYGGL